MAEDKAKEVKKGPQSPAPAKGPQGPPKAAQVPQNENFKHLVRIKNTDLPGNKSIQVAIQHIKGISFMFANALLTVAHIDPKKKAGDLTEEEMKKIEQVIENPTKFKIPDWLLNRRFDPETGETKHVFGSDLVYQRDTDIRNMKKMKSYKGIRHIFGLPVRGQRTKSNFRKNKGKPIAMKKKATIRK